MPDRRLARTMVACMLYSVVEYAYWAVVLIIAFDTGGATLAGVALIAQLVPAALLAPFLGALGDRLPRGTALSAVYAIEGVCLVGMTALVARDAPLALIVAASAVTTIIVSIGRPIHYAALPALAATPSSLVRANSGTSLADGIGVFLGPALAGIAAANVGFTPVVAACAVAMLLASIATLRLGLPAAARDGETSGSDVLAGLRVVTRNRGVLILLLLIGLSFVVAGSFEILGVAYATDALSGDAAASGIMLGAPGIGALIGSLLAAGLAVSARLVAPTVVSLAAAGVPLLIIVLVSSLPLAVVLLVLCGVGIAFSSVASRTLLQRAADDHVLARVFAVHEAMLLLGLALGAVIAPLLVARFGAAAAYLPVALGLMILTLAAWPTLRSLDDRSNFNPDVAALLQRVPFLASLSPPALSRLAQHTQWRDVAAGEVVITQGDVGDAFYVVDTGSLSVTVDSVLRQHQLTSGDGFGEIALLRDVPRTATVTALEPCRLLEVSRDDFLAAVTGNAEGHAVAESIAAAHLRRDHS